MWTSLKQMAVRRSRRLAHQIVDRPHSHSVIVALELGFERGLDAVTPRERDAADLLAQVTALIKTFERPRVVRRLVASIRRRYPDLRVIVVDDSREPTEIDGVSTLVLPYDSGLSVGRNEGLRLVETPYVLILDDDTISTARRGSCRP